MNGMLIWMQEHAAVITVAVLSFYCGLFAGMGFCIFCQLSNVDQERRKHHD